MDYTFGSTPLPTGLNVFNASIYRDINNRGDKGFQGADGVGSMGFQGVQGVQGFQGNQGIRGNQGLQGVQGLASPISVNNFVSGIQGLQSSFIYSGAQTIQTQFLNASSTTNIQSGALVVSSGRVGLSTTTPSYTLDVLNTGQSSTNLARFNTSVSAGTYVSWTQPEGISLFRFGTSNLLRMVAGTQSSSSIEFNSTSVRDGSIDYKHDTLPTTNRYMSFTTNQTERARIDSNGILSYSGVQGQQGYFDRTLYAKDNFGVGFQGIQGSFGFVGCQTIQGQQGYLSSSLQCKDIYGVGFQGVQGSFGYLGCNSLNTSSITLPSSFVNTFTPTISASNFTTVSNTGFYTTMSAVKTAYGSIKVQWVSYGTVSGITQGSFIFTLPVSFFSTIHSLQVCVSATPGWGIQWASANNFSTTSVEVSIFTNNGNPVSLQPTLSWYAIGN